MFTKTHRILTAFMVVGVLLAVLPAVASASGSEKCTTGNCQFIPATFTPESISVETTTSHGKSVKNVSIVRVQKEIRKYERTKHVKVAIYQNENGYEGDGGCIDPTKVKRWGFHAGDTFVNSDHLQNHFRDRWEKGWRVCDWQIRKKNGRLWVNGTKENCGNVDMWIPIRNQLPKPSVKSIEVKSYAVFWKKFVLKKKVTVESTFEGETVTTKGRYTCPPGWEVAGKMCKKCPPPQCEPCPYGSVWNGYECVKDGNTTPPPPPSAPGPNPPPSGGTGDPGSNKCYSEETGEPVKEQPGGGCPPGSHG